MKRKIKQLWSTIPPISTKQRKIKQLWSTIPPISTKYTITSHLQPLNIKDPLLKTGSPTAIHI
jgi:hypothetical protein